jgi:hypothetical protein
MMKAVLILRQKGKRTAFPESTNYRLDRYWYKVAN